MRAVFGRVETIDVAGKPVSILLIKNPAGANEVLRTLTLESANGGHRPLDRAQRQDRRRPRRLLDLGRRLRAALGRTSASVICAGTRAPEMALRLKYAGWPEEAIEVIGRIEGSLDAAVAAAPDRLFALPTYTALLELRTLLAERGLAADYWQ